MSENYEKPFSMGYVCRATIKYMRKSIDISLEKTISRIEEFAEDRERSKELLQTIWFLQRLKTMLDELESLNPDYFKAQ
jgi:hypothetical protein